MRQRKVETHITLTDEIIKFYNISENPSSKCFRTDARLLRGVYLLVHCQNIICSIYPGEVGAVFPWFSEYLPGGLLTVPSATTNKIGRFSLSFCSYFLLRGSACCTAVSLSCHHEVTGSPVCVPREMDTSPTPPFCMVKECVPQLSGKLAVHGLAQAGQPFPVPLPLRATRAGCLASTKDLALEHLGPEQDKAVP